MHCDSCQLDCYFGPLQRMWVARNPPSFVFVEFEDPRDAGLDGRTLCGCPLDMTEQLMLTCDCCI
ncbi:hypothetical protein FD755_011282 [Muntiacus reevesi]|uniref:RRM domain-containing protein n=1 Tax=Muntiacus reevesi TaxID=9886 RepID=A0A5N3XSA1_MUNRE|nr:hypothetical protein FD755_011282 [Muntiacus reevesi]